MSSGNGAFWWRWLAGTALLLGCSGAAGRARHRPRPERLLLLVALATGVLALITVELVSDGPDWSVYSIRRPRPRARTPGWACTPA